MFQAFYNLKRFRYVHESLEKTGMFKRVGDERISKTACFYSDAMNVYIDTSDGVNEDFGIHEYCGRAFRVIKDANGKPFLFFKAAHSPVWSLNLAQIIQDNNGEVVPFFKWSFNEDFYRNLIDKKKEIRSLRNKFEKKYDVGFFCGLRDYQYPKPSSHNGLISWEDHKKFNIGGNSKNTGFFTTTARKDIQRQLIDSGLVVLSGKKLSYKDYIRESLKCKVVINPPGIGEYTSRIFDQCFIGNCIAMRQTSYDQGASWKQHVPQIDFKDASWQSNVQKIIEDYSGWQQKSADYYDKFWAPDKVVQFMVEKIEAKF
tara:strand:- start:3038 stop:3982 length:945 start_codon:yes stop_codon:yes gene_type:complete